MIQWADDIEYKIVVDVRIGKEYTHIELSIQQTLANEKYFILIMTSGKGPYMDRDNTSMFYYKVVTYNAGQLLRYICLTYSLTAAIYISILTH